VTPATLGPVDDDRRRWRLGLALVCAVGLAVRVGYIVGFHHPSEVLGDPYQYHYGANLLVDGKGFIDAYSYLALHVTRQTVLHPPLTSVALALPSALGFDTVLDHQLFSCLMGTGTVAVTGLIGRRLGGARIGLIAAAVMALYPNAWLVDALLGLETLSLLTTAVVVLCAYRLWKTPSLLSAGVLGLACGIGVLARSEAAFFLPLVALPLIVGLRTGRAERLALVLVTALAMGATLAPWVGYNLGRFHHPVLVGRYDVAFAAANCHDTYYGSGIGYWSLRCFPYRVLPPGDDESDDAQVLSRAGYTYIKAHVGRVPFVVFARIGRTFGFYRPAQQVKIEGFAEGRPFQVGRAGLMAYYLLAMMAVPGAVLLRRRKMPLSPLLGLIATAVLTVALTYGLARYRITAEPALVLLAAVAVDGALSAYGRQRRWTPRWAGNRLATGPLQTPVPPAAGG